MRFGLLSSPGHGPLKHFISTRHPGSFDTNHIQHKGLIIILGSQSSKGRTVRSVVAHARRNRRRLRPSELSDDDLDVKERLQNQEGVLTQEMLGQEPPGHRAGEHTIPAGYGASAAV